jgi:hypothetical protein
MPTGRHNYHFAEGGLCLSSQGDEGRGGVQLADRRGRWVWVLSLAIAALVFLGFVWPLVRIQFRLSRNGAISRQLVESLHSRFPGVDFRGGASYEREVIYISVFEHVDETIRREVEQWLREEKSKQHIAPEIYLMFVGDGLDDLKL